MAAERRISILIDTAGNPAGIDLIEGRFAGMEASADRLFATLQAGAAIDIGGRLVSGLAAVPAAFERAIQRGVQFNATIETATIGIAAILRQFDTQGKYSTFNEAMAASADAIELLKQKAKESPATFQELVGAFQGTAGAMAAANIPLARQVDLIVNMSQALSGLGIRSEQILQETRALITGNINADAAAAKILGITAADINAAKAQGQLYEFLSGKISAFAEAGALGAKTMNAALSNLEDTIDNVLAQVTKPIFEGMTKGTLDLSKALSDPEIVDSLRGLGIEIAHMVELGYDLTEWAIKNQELLVFLARAAAAYGVAIATVNLTNLLVGLGKKAVALVASRLAIEAETTALARNTAAQVANAAARGAGGIPEARAMTRMEFFKASSQNWGNAPAGQALRQGVTNGTAGLKGLGAGALAAVPTVATAALVTYVVGEMIAQGIISRAEGRAASQEAASLASFKQVTGFAKESQEIATLKEKHELLKRIAKEQQIAAHAAAEHAGDAALSAIYKRQAADLDLIWDRTLKISSAELNRREAARATVQYLKDQAEAVARLAPAVDAAQKAIEDTQFAALSPEEQLKRLKEKRGEVAGGLSESEAGFAAAEGDAAASEAARLEVLKAKLKLADLDKVILALEEKIAAATKKTADEAARAVELKKSQADAKADITSDILASEARARGETDAAERLERQKKLREEIRAIVEATGVSEAEAERVARRKILAQEAAARVAAGGATVGGVAAGARRPETYDEINQRMSGGRIAMPSIRDVQPFSFVVPAAPAGARSRPAGAGATSGGGRGVSTDLLYQLTAELQNARGSEQENAAAEALKSYAATVRAQLAAGDRRYAALVEQIKIIESQIKNARIR